MDKAEFIRKRKEFLLQQAQMFEERPEIGRYMKMKKTFLWILAGMLGFHTVIEVWLMFLVPGFSGYDIGKEIIKLFILTAMLFLILNPQGGWRRILILYAYAALNVGVLVQYREDTMDVIVNLKYMPMPTGPLFAVMFFMEALFPFVLLAAALYLTVPLKHQVIADVVANAYKEAMGELKDDAR